MKEAEIGRQIIGTAEARIEQYGVREALGSRATAEDWFCEWVDNAITGTPEGEVCHVEIHLQARDSGENNPSYVKVMNYPAKAMTLDEASRLNTLGRRKEDQQYDTQSGRFGIDGLTAFLHAADQTHGDFSFQTPYEQGGYVHFIKYNWWNALELDVPLEKGEANETRDDQDTTVIKVTHLSDEAKKINVRKVADYLGAAYMVPILEGRLEISIKHQPEKSRKTYEYQVSPIDIPFDEGPYALHDDEEGIAVSDEKDAPRIKILWGKIDPMRYQEINRMRDKLYGGRTNRHKDTTIFRQSVLLFSGDRALTPTDLQSLKVPGATEKMSLNTLCVMVQLPLHRDIELGQLKKELMPRNQMTEKIYETIRTKLEPVVRQILEDPEPENLTAQHHKVLDRAHENLRELFDKHFDSSLAIAETFQLPTSFLSDSEDPDLSIDTPVDLMPKKGRKTSKDKPVLLPGIGVTRGPRGARKKEDKDDRKKDGDIEAVIEDGDERVIEINLEHPLPVFIAERLEHTALPVVIEERQLGDTEMLAVVFNVNNAFIEKALKSTRFERSVAQIGILREILIALFQRVEDMQHEDLYSREEVEAYINEILQPLVASKR